MLPLLLCGDRYSPTQPTYIAYFSSSFYEALKKSAIDFDLHSRNNHDTILLLGVARPYA
ncbi:MAG: hypothetical protein SWX82_19140 [Cyanobacteriota bacterium]|nr:hypothetical protein [Cyanobacteriota bacterium]